MEGWTLIVVMGICMAVGFTVVVLLAFFGVRWLIRSRRQMMGYYEGHGEHFKDHRLDSKHNPGHGMGGGGA